MTTENQEKKVAIIVADGFEQVELEVPRQALQKAGFAVEIISPGAQSTVQGYHHQEKGDAFPVDVPLAQARPEFYSALLLPGGVHNPDTLRQNTRVLDFVRHFFALGKPVAAICHGPWTLIDAAVVSGRRLTSWASIKTDLLNAGAEWVDEAVVVDRGLVTSRGPHDLPAFCKQMIEEFQQEHGVSAHEAAMLTKLNELIKNIKVAMLTMRMPDGSLHSCPMMTQGKRFDRSLWFFTAASSYKGQEAERECPVNVSYADPAASRYVSVSGRAKLVRDRGKLQELWTPLVKAWFPRGLDDPELSLLQVAVEHAEYWDTPSGNAVTLFQLAKLLLTGRPYQGEGTSHERIQIEPPRGEAAPPRDSSQAAEQVAGKAPGQSFGQTSGQTSGRASEPEADRGATRLRAPDSASDSGPSADSGAGLRARTDMADTADTEGGRGADRSAEEAAPAEGAARPAPAAVTTRAPEKAPDKAPEKAPPSPPPAASRSAERPAAKTARAASKRTRK